MKSETAQRILSETPKETIDKVRKTANELVMKELINSPMSAEEFYDSERIKGETYFITSNPDPDYTTGFYREIFQLMQGYHKHCLSQRIDELAERMYSEEEVYRKLHDLMVDIKLNSLVINDDMDLKEWFSQNKKK